MVYHALAKRRLTTQAPPCTGRPAATLDAMRASSTTEAPRSSTVPFTGFAALDAPAAFYDIDDGLALNQLAAWAPSAAIRRKILVDNPTRLYDF